MVYQMMSNLKRLFNTITVKESNGIITIDGLNSLELSKDIQKIWRTSRISKHMFHRLTRSSISFYSFYLIEVYFILNKIKEANRSFTTNRSIQHILNLLDEETWLSGANSKEYTSKLNLNKLKLFKKSPLEHQTNFLETYDKNTQKYDLKGYMLASPPGTGKTLANLYLAECLNKEVIIMVSPLAAVEKVWEASLLEEYKVPQTDYWISKEGGSPPLDKKFYITHYESLPRLIGLVEELAKRKKSVYIALDESHNLNEINSLRTQTFMTICEILKNNDLDVIWASGTPLKAMGAEMIPFITTIDDMFNKSVEDSFKKIFGMSSERAGEILQNRIGVTMFQVPKSAVRDTTPIEEDVKVTFRDSKKFTMSVVRQDMLDFVEERIKYYKANFDKYEKDYLDAIATFENTLKNDREKQELVKYKKDINTIRRTRDIMVIRDLIKDVNKYEKTVIEPSLPSEQRKAFRAAKSVIKYVELKIRGEALGTVLGRRRIDCSVAIAMNADIPAIIDASEKKTLIFSGYVKVVEALQERLTKLGYKPNVVYAKTSSELKAIVNKFQSDKTTNPLIATYDSLSTAVPITAASSVILVDQPFRDYIRDQAISRADRLGNDSQVYVHNLLLDTGSEVNVSTRSLDIMKWYKEQVDMMLGLSGVSVENEMYMSGIEEVVRTYPLFKYTKPLPKSLRWK